MIELQNYSPLVPLQPIEADYAIYDLQTKLKTNLLWISHAYGRAYKVKKENTDGRALILPMVYVSNTDGKYSYTPVTPDNDKKGTVFFVVEKEKPLNFESNTTNYLTYNVGVVFWVNLELVDKEWVKNEDFTQSLIREARGVLTNKLLGAGYKLKIQEIVREQNEVFKEFSLNDYDYNRLPFTAFRINTTVTLREDCLLTTDRQNAILQNVSKTELLQILLPTLDFTGSDFDALTEQQKEDLTNRLT